MNLEKALFIDIETHRGKEFSEISPQLQDTFITHYYNKNEYGTPDEQYIVDAGLYPEFSQVVCATFGFENTVGGFSTKSFYGTNEKKILESLANIFERTNEKRYFAIGHAISTFDIPYLIKRYIINGIRVPDLINEVSSKPWERKNVDTMSLWKFGSFRGTSLSTVCSCLGIECKSTEITGENLHLRKLEEIDWEELKKYCEEDVESNYRMVKRILELINV